MFSLATFAFASVFLATAHAQCTRTYTVVTGDTCDLISEKEGVSSFQLTSVNSATINSECSNLFVGEVLCLATQEEDCTDVAVVQSGESCLEIADNSGISVTWLIENNPNVNTDCTNLRPGEVLCVARTSIFIRSGVVPSGAVPSGPVVSSRMFLLK
ncbi:hypothetical protein BDQ17DRAFT_1425955 [Cyathus striatus]|nr:hypothetical protein BDQ17DRAFT_1425955 [Cyathus striatus]